MNEKDNEFKTGLELWVLYLLSKHQTQQVFWECSLGIDHQRTSPKNCEFNKSWKKIK